MLYRIARKIIVTLAIGLVPFFFIQATQKKNMEPNPCNDSLLLCLKEKPFDSMTVKELEFFIFKAKECSDYRRGKEKRKSDTTDTLRAAKADKSTK